MIIELHFNLFISGGTKVQFEWRSVFAKSHKLASVPVITVNITQVW